MNVEQKLRELAEIKRPFSQPFPATIGAVYLIDSTFAFRSSVSSHKGRHVIFVADMQLPIKRGHVRKERDQQHGTGIGQLVLSFRPSQRVVYLGDKYEFALMKEGARDYFLLKSTSPINSESVPNNIDLRELVAQRTSSLKI